MLQIAMNNVPFGTIRFQCTAAMLIDFNESCMLETGLLKTQGLASGSCA
jgi:hypothetical protein